MKSFATVLSIASLVLLLVPGCGASAQAESACDTLIEAESAYAQRCGAPTRVYASGFREYCTRVLSADGMDPEAAVACAKAKENLACDVTPEVQAACANKVLGKRADGRGCSLDDQCGSGYCKGGSLNSGTCGVCAAASPVGGPCESHVQCETGLTCAQRSSGQRVCARPLEKDADCRMNAEGITAGCAPGLACVAEVKGPGATCRPVGGTGDACDGGVPCGGAQTCIAGRCAPLPRTGESCVKVCAGDDECNAAGKCAPRVARAVGETCSASAGQFCDEAAFCDGGRCKARKAPGEACGGGDSCAIYYACVAGVCALPDVNACQ